MRKLILDNLFLSTIFRKKLSFVLLSVFVFQFFAPFHVFLEHTSSGIPKISFERLGVSASSPGGTGTGDLVLWLKADTGVTGTTNVSAWADQSGNNNNAVGASANGGSALPVYVSGDMQHNFNPTMSFSGGNSSSNAPYFDVADGFNDFTNGGSYFTVSKPTSTAEFGRIFDFGQNNDDDNIWLGRYALTSDMVFETLNGGTKNKITGGSVLVNNSTDIFSVSHGSGVAGSVVAASLYKNGEELSTDNQVFVPSNVVRDKNYIARSNWSADDLFQGEISEIIMYNKELSSAEKARVNSYLALKYGITLDSSIGNYLNTASSSVYDFAADTNYQSYIVGIAKDQELDQRVSKSQETGSVLILTTDDAVSDFTSVNGGSRTQMADGEYVILGSDNGALTSSTTSITGYSNKIARQWRAEVTNYTGDVNVKFDIPAISGTDWDLVQSDTSDFSTSTTLTKVADLDTNGEALDVTFTDGKYYAIIQTQAVLYGPANVDTGISLWLNANTGVTRDNPGTDEGVSSWADQSGNTNTANQSTDTDKPEYTPNFHNFNSALNFDTGTQELSLGLGVPSVNSIAYMIATPKSSGTGVALSNNPTREVSLLSNGSNFGSFSVAPEALHISTAGYTASTPSLIRVDNNNGTSQVIGVNGLDTPTYTSLSDQTINTIGNAGDAAAQPFGYISEVVIYDQASQLSSDRQKIESYLALKYGITLSGTGYVNSSGSTVYDLTNGYNQNIVGLGNDESLDQRVSKSENAGSIFTLATDNDFTSSNGVSRTQMGANTYIVLGSTGSTSTGNIELPSGYTERLEREWKVQETGTVGSLHLKFDGYNGDWDLIEDTDGDFSNATKVADLSSAGIVNYDLVDGRYYTIAQPDPTPIVINVPSPTKKGGNPINLDKYIIGNKKYDGCLIGDDNCHADIDNKNDNTDIDNKNDNTDIDNKNDNTDKGVNKKETQKDLGDKSNKENSGVVKQENKKDLGFINNQKYTVDSGICEVSKNFIDAFEDSNKKTSFNDINNSKYKNEIISAEKVGIINGTSPNNFSPLLTITRSEFLAIILKSHCIDISHTSDPYPFADTDVVDWQKNVIKAGYKNNIIVGSAKKYDLGIMYKPVSLKSTKTDIKKLQILLKDFGLYNKGEIDGIYNANLIKTISDFQLKHSVIKSFDDLGTGYWGENTRAMFKKIYNPKKEVRVFKPNSPISKIEAIAILFKMKNIDISDYEHSYKDPAASWQDKYIAIGEKLGLFDPNSSNGYFYPDSNITREKMMYLLRKTLLLYTKNFPLETKK